MADPALLAAIIGSEYGMRRVADIVASGQSGIVAQQAVQRSFFGIEISLADAQDVLNIVRQAYSKAVEIEGAPPGAVFQASDIPMIEYFADIRDPNARSVVLMQQPMGDIMGLGGMKGTLDIQLNTTGPVAIDPIRALLAERIDDFRANWAQQYPELIERFPEILSPIESLSDAEMGRLLAVFRIF